MTGGILVGTGYSTGRSVRRVESAAEVHGSEDREDERLDQRHTDLEGGEGHEAGEGADLDETSAEVDQTEMHSTPKVMSRMWPASMLAKRRTAWPKGRTRKVERNSIGVTSR